MDQRIKERMGDSIQDFRLPRYREIPDVGLYLEQVTKYISDCLAPLGAMSITGSMISNYVKKGLIPSPVRKQYDRERIAQLIYIAVVKTVVSIEDLRLMLNIQRKTYLSQVAYDYFCLEFENVLKSIFGMKEPEQIGSDDSDEKTMLRNTIITVTHKVYLDTLFAALREQEEYEGGKQRSFPGDGR